MAVALTTRSLSRISPSTRSQHTSKPLGVRRTVTINTQVSASIRRRAKGHREDLHPEERRAHRGVRTRRLVRQYADRAARRQEAPDPAQAADIQRREVETPAGPRVHDMAFEGTGLRPVVKEHHRQPPPEREAQYFPVSPMRNQDHRAPGMRSCRVEQVRARPEADCALERRCARVGHETALACESAGFHEAAAGEPAPLNRGKFREAPRQVRLRHRDARSAQPPCDAPGRGAEGPRPGQRQEGENPHTADEEPGHGRSQALRASSACRKQPTRWSFTRPALCMNA